MRRIDKSYLTGKLERSTEVVKNKESEILSAVNKSLQVSKRLETAVKETVKAEPKQPSYAEKVKMTYNKVEQMPVKPPKNVVIIRPEGTYGKFKSSEDAREAAFTLASFRKKGI
jgi:hypothetical protein